MSHAKLRKENNCLNCNAIVSGRFCSVCGQENVEIHETFGHLATHLVSDIFHFDGMFFSTAKSLLFKPGFLTYEYMRGRRASYLNPVKMYVFISAVFFLLFLSFFKPEINLTGDDDANLSAKEVKQKMIFLRNTLVEVVKSPKVPQMLKDRSKEKLALVNKNIALLEKDTTNKKKLLNEVNSFDINGKGIVLVSDNDYNTVAQYDSAQKTKPEAEKDNWLTRKMSEKSITIDNKFAKDRSGTTEAMEESFFHHFPQMLFISLPLFSLVLLLLYRRRKAYNLGSHLIFTTHLYCAFFLFIFLVVILGKAEHFSGFHWLQWVSYAVIVYGIYYSFRAMRVYYAQSMGKTIAKWLLLYFAAYIINLLLFVGLLLFTFFIV